MRHLRPITAILAIAAVTVACGGPAGASAGEEASRGAGASQPVASSGGGGGGGGGGGANGSVTYQVSGGYSRSGELPWVPLASTFTDGIWYLAFADTSSGENQDTLVISGAGGTKVVVFGNNEFGITGGVEPACTFNFTRQDASGAAGSFDCHGVMGIKADGTLVQVDFKGTFDGRK